MDLPNNNELKRISKRIALFDAVIEPEWEYRYYSHNSRWDKFQEMASMRDGSGNHYFILFKKEHCCIKVIDKIIDNKTKIFNILDNYPDKIKNELYSFLNEPAFYIDELSFLYWNFDRNWNQIEIGTNDWLKILINPEKEYQKHVAEYFEKTISNVTIKNMFRDEINIKLLKQINPNFDLDDIEEDIEEIGIKIELK